MYAVHHLKKPKDLDMELEFVCLGEPKSKKFVSISFNSAILLLSFSMKFKIENKINNLCAETFKIYSFSSSKPKDPFSRLR